MNKLNTMIKYILLFAVLLIGGNAQAQRFDSVRIYPLCMKSMYRITIGQDLIKNEVDTVILLNAEKATEIYTFLKDSVCNLKLDQVYTPGLDIRLYLEFFQKGSIVKTIGVSPKRTIYIDSVIYTCNSEVLKSIDYFSPNLSSTLCLQ